MAIDDLTQKQFNKFKLTMTYQKIMVNVAYDKKGIEYWVAHKYYHECPKKNSYKIAEVKRYKK